MVYGVNKSMFVLIERMDEDVKTDWLEMTSKLLNEAIEGMTEIRFPIFSLITSSWKSII